MMSGTLIFESSLSDKAARYKELLPQLEALIHGEKDETACLANAAAALAECFHFFWVGFYRVQQTQLILGPFQGPVACTRIHKGKGVCGTAWEKNQTILVPDVDEFPGHIACSSLSRSEIVVPIHFTNGDVAAILDVDSTELNNFDEQDRLGLEAFCKLLEKHLYSA
jgi:L-methionine (R)-S-oxide reductase